MFGDGARTGGRRSGYYTGGSPGDSCGPANRHSSADGDEHSYTRADEHRNFYSDSRADQDKYADAIADRDVYADTDTDHRTNSHGNEYPGADSYGHGDFYVYPNA